MRIRAIFILNDLPKGDAADSLLGIDRFELAKSDRWSTEYGVRSQNAIKNGKNGDAPPRQGRGFTTICSMMRGLEPCCRAGAFQPALESLEPARSGPPSETSVDHRERQPGTRKKR